MASSHAGHSQEPSKMACTFETPISHKTPPSQYSLRLLDQAGTAHQSNARKLQLSMEKTARDKPLSRRKPLRKRTNSKGKRAQKCTQPGPIEPTSNEYVVEDVIKKRTDPVTFQDSYLVAWSGYPREEATWEEDPRLAEIFDQRKDTTYETKSKA
ncbi:hypothetical protein GGR54DRAFT_599085 [Hypoxylon sp. NC1633]|nr:hypothetical protein GGR54DRAFT_599085 [Hypoxylon sp. NC1633]